MDTALAVSLAANVVVGLIVLFQEHRVNMADEANADLVEALNEKESELELVRELADEQSEIRLDREKELKECRDVRDDLSELAARRLSALRQVFQLAGDSPRSDEIRSIASQEIPTEEGES